MKKKRNILFKKTDKTVILICSLGIIFSLIGYFRDVYKTNLRTDEKPIALLTNRNKSVQRRFRDRLVWDIIRENTPLYVGDFVRTTAFADAEITFDSGTIINMSHNSLIEILPESDIANLKITSGTVSIKTPEKITLKAGRETLEIGEDSIVSMNIQPELLPQTDEAVTPLILSDGTSDNLASAAQNRHISVSVEKGMVRQSKSDGSIIELNAGSQIVMDSDGHQLKQPAIIMISPKVSQKIIKNDNETAKLHFNWKALNYEPGMFTKIELSYDKDGIYPYQNELVEAEEITFTLPNRTVYWKAYPVSKDGETDAYKEAVLQGSISVFSITPIKKLQPVNNVGLTYKAAQNGVQFAWTQDDLARGYELLIADNAEMENAVISYKTAKTEAKLDAIDYGTWYWQIVPIYDDSIQASPALSAVNTFTVQKPVSLKPVVTYKPEDNYIAYTANGRQPVLFNWASASGAVSYTLKIADNPRLKNPVAEINCNQTYYSLNTNQFNITEGKHWYWAITFTDKEGNTAPFTDVKSFYPLSHSPYFKALSPNDNITISLEDFFNTIFAVETNIPIDGRFVVSKSADFEDLVIDAKIKAEAFKISTKLEPGFYYWKIINGNYSTSTRSFLIKSDSQESTKQIEYPEMAYISSSDFTMGNDSGTSYEKGEHQVHLSSFYIGKTEITKKQFNQLAGRETMQEEENLPVTGISWFEAVDYCNKLSMLQGLEAAYTVSGSNVIWNQKANGYRLLTEAEWEYAAKTSAQSSVWTKDNGGNKAHAALSNATIENLLGNVSEWCWDYLGYYRKNSETNPSGITSGTERVIRGGNYNSSLQKATPTFREGQKPQDKSQTTGFRIARNGE